MGMEQMGYTSINREETPVNELAMENREDENHLDDSAKRERLHKDMLGYQFDYIYRIKKNLIDPLEENKSIAEEN